jgi:ketosteroid isomerase-like protein
LLAKWTVGFLLLFATAAAAQEIKAPHISYLPVDWDAALAALHADAAVRRLPAAPALSPSDADSDRALLARLNAATGRFLPKIAASPVPVLLPVKLDALAGDNAGGPAQKNEKPAFPSDFGAPELFLAGPAGYDAAFTVTLPQRSKSRPARRVEIDISGFALLYDIGARNGGEEKPPAGLQADFPGIRRFYFESHMRYLFTRYGVLYDVSIECFEGRSNLKRLSCRDAHTIAVPFLKALTVAGGTPQPIPQAAGVPAASRPKNYSPMFAYYAPGDLIPGTGSRKRGGVSDYTVFSTIRFPLAEAPAQTYSQIFMDLGDCTEAVGDSQKKRRHGAPFHCPSSDKAAVAALPNGGQYAYPWRDNFCEVRGFYVGQCPGGLGHQGEDIVPVDCRLTAASLDQCDRKDHAVVAVHDGMVLRERGQESLVIIANDAGEHVFFRYLHMNPKLIDENGFFSGRVVHEADVVGKVDNYAGHDAGTSYHLHFDMEVPTKDGWAFVNPYMTLVVAYEKLIGGRGTRIPDEIRETPVAGAESGKTASIADKQAGKSPSKHKAHAHRR